MHCVGNQYVFYHEYIKHSLYKKFCKWFELAKDRVMWYVGWIIYSCVGHDGIGDWYFESYNQS